MLVVSTKALPLLIKCFVFLKWAIIKVLAILKGLVVMSKHVEAYFKTENDAESAKAELQSLRTENELVEAIPEDANLTTSIIPLGGANQFGAGAGVAGALDPDDESAPGSNDEHLTHLLQFQVHEEDFDQALHTIQKHYGHMDQSHL